MHLPSSRLNFRFLLASTTCLVLASCYVERAPDKDTADQEPTVTATPQVGTESPVAPVPTATVAAKTWIDIPVADPANRVTIHYHRQDESYDGAVLWSWDAHEKNTPPQNEIAPIGRDDFGLVFQLDRANYGGSDKIGLIPRVGHDWSRKDGTDKFWMPALGRELWLISNKNDVFTKRPDTSPHVEAASIDAPNKIVVRLSNAAPALPKVSILNAQNAVRETVSAADLAATTAPPFELTITPREPLDFTRQHYRVRVEGFGEAVPLTPRGLLDDRALFFDADAILGAVSKLDATTFRVFAPTAQSVSVVLYDEATGSKNRALHVLSRQAKGLWEATVSGDLRGKFYAFLLDGPGLDATREVLDPYAVNSVANSTRGRITEIPVTTSAGPHVESPTDMVIYEMHVRDFTNAANSGVKNRGLYLGWTEANTRLAGDAQIRTALDHLTELGVTHVQILPVQDFENDEASRKYNWGYITNGFFSPEGLFASNPADDSRVRELQALVAALHARGIGVIMDVVYNHTAENAPFRFIAPQYYYRHLADGSLANGSGCGNEFRTEAPMTRKFIVESLKFWVKQYGIDGFRFDLMGLLDQETMREVERELHAMNPGIVLYGEPWTAGATPLLAKTDKDALHQVNVGAFNDDFRNALKGSPDGHEPGFIQNGSNRDALKAAMRVSPWFTSPAQSLNYMTCHDNLVLYDKLKVSMPGANETLVKDTMKLGYLALFTAQGVPFLHGGEEFARTKGGNNNSYDSPDSVNEVNWSLKRKNYELFTYTRDLIALRKAHPVFRLRTRAEIAARLRFEDGTNEKVIAFSLDGVGVPRETWKRVFVALNSDDQASAQIELPAGTWLVALDDRGAATGSAVHGSIIIRRKSGVVLYQR